MSKNIIAKHHLDFGKTITYFIDHIQSGKSLSNKLIENLNFEKGEFFTFLPLNACLDRLYEFPFGGIIPTIPYGTQTYYIESYPQKFHPQQVITMGQELAKWILTFIQKQSNNFAVVESYNESAHSPNTGIKNVRMIPFEDEVYYFLDQKNSVDEIHTTLRFCNPVWCSLIVLIENRNFQSASLQTDDLESFCNHAKYIITGAYDDESYVIWQQG